MTDLKGILIIAETVKLLKFHISVKLLNLLDFCVNTQEHTSDLLPLGFKVNAMLLTLKIALLPRKVKACVRR